MVIGFAILDAILRNKNRPLRSMKTCGLPIRMLELPNDRMGVTSLKPRESLTLHQQPPRQASMNSSIYDGADFDQNTSVRGRRRQRNPENWAFNIAKRKRNKGEENVDKKGKQVKSREMQWLW
ncbi:hypothetical protein PoB_007308800 [Plakobranchus ocellatus]|uniref:Uncharacterized protein n=1 Tax=Plakobranchus ocellatus TaxID=259542 RepID=A0AAV4DR93_9GAST|nr:hypothetical protein PoB_007308800 [Plakobranchus ocellatus]